MPRPHFIKVFAGDEGSKRWVTAETERRPSLERAS